MHINSSTKYMQYEHSEVFYKETHRAQRPRRCAAHRADDETHRAHDAPHRAGGETHRAERPRRCARARPFSVSLLALLEVCPAVKHMEMGVAYRNLSFFKVRTHARSARCWATTHKYQAPE